MELVDGKLFSKVIQGIKAVAGAKAFLTLSVVALLSIVMKRVGEDQLISDAQCDSGNLNQGRQIPLAVGKLVGKFKAISGLYTFHLDT